MIEALSGVGIIDPINIPQWLRHGPNVILDENEGYYCVCVVAAFLIFWGKPTSHVILKLLKIYNAENHGKNWISFIINSNHYKS